MRQKQRKTKGEQRKGAERKVGGRVGGQEERFFPFLFFIFLSLFNAYVSSCVGKIGKSVLEAFTAQLTYLYINSIPVGLLLWAVWAYLDASVTTMLPGLIVGLLCLRRQPGCHAHPQLHKPLFACYFSNTSYLNYGDGDRYCFYNFSLHLLSSRFISDKRLGEQFLCLI